MSVRKATRAQAQHGKASSGASEDLASQVHELQTMLLERNAHNAALLKRIEAVEPWQGKGKDDR
jgi:hypothetical protein